MHDETLSMTFPGLSLPHPRIPPALRLEQMPAALQTHCLEYLASFLASSHLRLSSNFVSPVSTSCWIYCLVFLFGVPLGCRVHRIV